MVVSSDLRVVLGSREGIVLPLSQVSNTTWICTSCWSLFLCHPRCWTGPGKHLLANIVGNRLPTSSVLVSQLLLSLWATCARSWVTLWFLSPLLAALFPFLCFFLSNTKPAKRSKHQENLPQN